MKAAPSAPDQVAAVHVTETSPDPAEPSSGDGGGDGDGGDASGGGNDGEMAVLAGGGVADERDPVLAAAADLAAPVDVSGGTAGATSGRANQSAAAAASVSVAPSARVQGVLALELGRVHGGKQLPADYEAFLVVTYGTETFRSKVRVCVHVGPSTLNLGLTRRGLCVAVCVCVSRWCGRDGGAGRGGSGWCC
jgi:hypothetical protein